MTLQEPAQPDSVNFPPELLASLAALVAQQPAVTSACINEQHVREAHANEDAHDSRQLTMAPIMSDTPGMDSIVTPPTQSCVICPSVAELGYCLDPGSCSFSHDPAAGWGPSVLLDNVFGPSEHEVPPLSLGHLDPRTIRLFKTRFCSFGPECPYRLKGRCIYAHTKEEMRNRPPPPSNYPRIRRRMDSSTSWETNDESSTTTLK